MARRTLEAMMLDAAPSADRRDHRVVASVLAYLSESIIRSDHILLFCDTPLGATDEEVDGLVALSGRWDPPLWKHPGPDIFEAIRSAGVPSTARGVWTVEEVLDYAVDLIREVVPELSVETIERIATECAYAVDDALVGGDRVDWSPRAPERAVEEWVIANLDEVARRCDLPPLALYKSQVVFADRGRADVVCRSIAGDENFERGTWVIIELKAGMLIRDDVDQLARYLRSAQSELADPVNGVLGVLIGDGVGPGLEDYIHELQAPVVAQDLVSVGFHRAVFDELRSLERDEPGS